MKSISIKTDDEIFLKLQLITFKASSERKEKVYMRDIVLEAIQNYAFDKYSGYLEEPSKNSSKKAKK